MRPTTVPLAIVLLAGGCGQACRNDVVALAAAPGGKHQVAMFSRDCGATTGYSTQVSVIGGDEQPTEGGNVFVADGGTVATAWGGPWTEVVWLGPDRLLVRYDSHARIFKKADKIAGVAISYQPVVR
ncbi:MAG TPA: hypothetical protein VF485_02205 [Sphingomonas sp.]